MPVIKNQSKKTTTPIPPTLQQTTAVESPFFKSDPGIHLEAKLQKLLIQQTLKTKLGGGERPRLRGLLQEIVDAHEQGIILTVADPYTELWDYLGFSYNFTEIQIRNAFSELEKGGYLEIATPHPKDPTYRITKKTYDTLNSVHWSPLSRDYQEEEHRFGCHLIPFDPGIYLDRVPSRDPRDLEVTWHKFYLIPVKEGFIALTMDQSEIYTATVDLRGLTVSPDDYRTDYHKRWYQHISAWDLDGFLDRLLSLSKQKSRVVRPFCIAVDLSDADDIIVANDRGRYFYLKENILLYIYNTYWGEDLEFRVSANPVSPSSDFPDYLLTVWRREEHELLLIHQFSQEQPWIDRLSRESEKPRFP